MGGVEPHGAAAGQSQHQEPPVRQPVGEVVALEVGEIIPAPVADDNEVGQVQVYAVSSSFGMDARGNSLQIGREPRRMVDSVAGLVDGSLPLPRG